MESKSSVLCLMLFLTGVVHLSVAVQRVYYIGAIEINWDYAPGDRNLVNGNVLDQDR